jgi:uroporphyrin-III C-methyltransferase/precorrin-2 dehydrogenase/sirohydrochlorin ferrochelatase
MSRFPIFLELGGAAPLVAGGGELAAAKVRLLLKRCGRVAVAAERLVPELADLLVQGAVEQIGRSVDLDHIRGRPLVIAATGDEAEDARISRLARSLGVPVNVPDRPELCSFILGAIVDRGAVTVAIGTEGAAPVLATRLRSFLERELHPRLGRLAEIAAEYRDAVARHLPPGAARRSFWEGIFGGPAGEAILDGREAEGRKLIGAALDGSRIERRGRVLLVGAGPGDPDLLTLKAVRALKSADVILYDHLIGEGVLDHARREAALICVGKRKGRHSRSQAEINALMVALAREGKTVVRLKGGDPFVFGRGGEEVETLRASGIPVEVVPGITAATAAAASLQVPLTHRELSHSVTFISGHAAGDGEPDFGQVDFRALARGHATLAVYMGVSTARALGRKLLASGWSPATPVMAVERAAHPGERRVATSLDVLAAEPERLALAGPAILLIGEVAGLDAAGEIESVASRAGLGGTLRREAAIA